MRGQSHQGAWYHYRFAVWAHVGRHHSPWSWWVRPLPQGWSDVVPVKLVVMEEIWFLSAFWSEPT